jgi:hypothetical protein
MAPISSKCLFGTEAIEGKPDRQNSPRHRTVPALSMSGLEKLERSRYYRNGAPAVFGLTSADSTVFENSYGQTDTLPLPAKA